MHPARRTWSRHFVGFVGAAVLSCAETDLQSRREVETDAAPEQVDLSALGDRILDDLAAPELRAVCGEQSRRVDACLEEARLYEKMTAECEAAARMCRDRGGAESTEPNCNGVFEANAGPCTVTVDEYLNCLDAWNLTMSCDLAGHVAAPPACATLVPRCERFRRRFAMEGKPLPCTAEEKAAKPLDNDDDIFGLDACRPAPEKLVVLGDSIAACLSAPSEDECAPNLIAAHLRTRVNPGLILESHALFGATVADLAGQAALVEGGPGHVFVWIYAIGNDLLSGESEPAPLIAGYESVFDYFTDTTRFPDGATFLLNTQYDPNDQCTARSDASESALSQAILRLNRPVFMDVAEARSDAVAIDMLPDFLGHGANANVSGCPHCGPDNSPWLLASHPRAVGYRHMAAKWEKALDAMLACP